MSKKNNQLDLARRPIKEVKNEDTIRALEDEEEETDSETTDDETAKKLYPSIPTVDDFSTDKRDCQLLENQSSIKKIDVSFRVKYKISADKTSETSKTGSSSGTLFVIKLFIFVIVPFLLGIYLKYFWSQSSPSFYPPSINVSNILLTMKKNFSQQDNKIFKILESALNTINSRPEPKSPEILLLVSVGGSESISLEFSRQLADSISEKPIVMSGTKLSKQDPNIAKMEICDTIKSKIMEDNLSVIVLNKLEQLSFESAIILHSYCDHENAPFKRVVYIMTVSCQHQKATAKWDEIANQCLEEAWKSADKEEVSALLSRITVRVMLIQPPSQK